MFRKTMVSVCLILSLSAVSQARIIKCIDDKGVVYFTDTGCPKQQKNTITSDHDKPDISGLTLNKQQPVKSLEFYCNSGKGKFVRC